MREGWKEVVLNDVAPYFTKKIEAKELNAENYVSADNMLVNKGGIVNSVYVPTSGKSTLYDQKDILVSNIRPYFKKIWLAKSNGGCSNDVIVFRTIENIADPSFIYYHLSKDDFFDYMMAGSNGTKMPRGNKKSIPEYKILLPPLPTQRKIASILSAYDDLIDNNLKCIKLLEEKSQLTYEEWFVKMRFPGYETVKLDDVTGLPDGWKTTDLSNYISIKHGYAYKGQYFKEEETNRILLTPGNFKIGGGIKLDKVKYYDEVAECPNDYVLYKHDLLLTMTDLSKMGDTLGFPLLVPTNNAKTYLHNQRLGKIIPVQESVFPKYFYYMYFQDVKYRSFVVGSSSGATVKHTAPKKILAFKPTLPPIDGVLIQNFNNYIKNHFESIDFLIQQNSLLREARDILLPRLMSGTIDVEELEIESLQITE